MFLWVVTIGGMSLSLYIHIPFCSHKCSYCSFPVIPIEKLLDKSWFTGEYKQALFRDMDYRATKLWTDGKKPSLCTLYFGGWTPLLFWSEYICEIIDYVADRFDLRDLAELSIECNPYPYKETLVAVQNIIDRYATFSCLRFSFGIQSLDAETLDIAWRDTDLRNLQQFSENLLTLRDAFYDKQWEKKSSQIVYNYDFIAFGKDTKTAENRWLQELVSGKKIDSFSLYTLELFPGSQWYHGGIKDNIVAYNAPWDNKLPYIANEDSLWEDFSRLQKLFLEWWYQRYEISNYALVWKESKHNMVYRTMKPYIGIWLGAHGLVEIDKVFYRTTSAYGWKKYIQWPTEELLEREIQSDEDFSVESFFLWLRQIGWVENIGDYAAILVENYDSILRNLQDEWFVVYDGKKLSLTNEGMNVHHHICTKIMKTI